MLPVTFRLFDQIDPKNDSGLDKVQANDSFRFA